MIKKIIFKQNLNVMKIINHFINTIYRTYNYHALNERSKEFVEIVL